MKPFHGLECSLYGEVALGILKVIFLQEDALFEQGCEVHNEL